MFHLLRANEDSSLAGIVATYRKSLFTAVFLSAALNLLLLAGSIFMMLVYDAVLPSSSLPTLVGLLALVALAYVFLGFFDLLRNRILSNLGIAIDLRLTKHLHNVVGTLALHRRSIDDPLKPLNDLAQVRNFLGGVGPVALIDMPWALFFVVILFLLHPWLGLTVLAGAIMLGGLAMATEVLSRDKARALSATNAQKVSVSLDHVRHAEVVHSMGMSRQMENRWFRANEAALDVHRDLVGIASNLGVSSKVFRMLLQSVVLAVGAWLVIGGKSTGGIIFASAVISSRALAPVEIAIANWRVFLSARQSWQRLNDLLREFPMSQSRLTALPPPCQRLDVDGLTLCPPGGDKPLVNQLSLTINAGQALGIIGPSGCGKTTVLRGLLGLWPATSGSVRLDGAALDQWDLAELGRHVGYLPQNAELIDGTVAENIARFDPDAPLAAIFEAAKAAGVHDLIVGLPKGYDTPVSTDGSALSAGQRQRIALARALYGAPFILLLDEPNSNLDTDGEDALVEAMRLACDRGSIVIVVAHRPSILRVVDQIMVLKDGERVALGQRDDILAQVLLRPTSVNTPTNPKNLRYLADGQKGAE